MKARLFSCAVIFGLVATTADADPCVSSTFDLPLPGATNVQSHVSDVPTAQFPAFWQDGNINGYAYTIFATNEGTLRPTDALQDWVITMTCNVSEQTCDMAHVGVPPEDAEIVSRSVGQCLLGAEVVAVAAAPVAPMPVETTQPIDDAVALGTIDTIAADAPTLCSAATVDEANDVAAVQRLLILAGEDPGQVDGILGPKSFAAMEAFSTGASTNQTLAEMIDLLAMHLCGPLVE